MANVPEWRFFLCKSPAPGVDPSLPLERVAWLRKASSKTLALAQNRGGECGANYPLRDKWSPYFFQGVNYCIEARRGNDIEWSGPIANNSGSAQTSKMGQISWKAVGWLELLTRRELRQDVTYGAVNPATGNAWTDAEIVFDLLDKVIAYDPTHAPPIRKGIAVGTRYPRQKSWQRGTKIEQCFRELIELEAGINIEVDPTTRLLNIYSWDSYTDHPNLVYGFNKPPHNIASFGWQVDHLVTNRLTVNGAPGVTPAIDEDVLSQDTYGLMEDTVNLTDVKQSETLLYYAAAEIAVKSRPIIHYTFTPSAWRRGMPKPLDDFKIGDRLRLSVDYGPIQEASRPVRAYGMSFDLDGGEKLTQFQTQVN